MPESRMPRMPEGVAMVVVGLAAVLDSVLEDDSPSRAVVSRLFFVLVTLLPHGLRGVSLVETGKGKPLEISLFSQVGQSQVDFASYFTPK